MTKYIAITTITHTVRPGKAKTATSAVQRPVTKEIGPGTIIVIDDEARAEELIALGAIRAAKKDDLKEAEVQNLDDLTEEQLQAAAVADAQHKRELEAEAKRRAEAEKTPAPKAAANKAAANKAAGKPAESAADAKNGDTGPAGTGGNADGKGTNAGANTTADANNNPAGTDDGGLV